MQKILLAFQLTFSTVLSFRVVKHTQTADVSSGASARCRVSLIVIVKALAPGGSVTLTCQTNAYYEYCGWRHVNNNARHIGVRECHFEWKRKHVRYSLPVDRIGMRTFFSGPCPEARVP